MVIVRCDFFSNYEGEKMKGLYKKIGATIVGAIAAVNVMALDELNVAYFESGLCHLNMQNKLVHMTKL